MGKSDIEAIYTLSPQQQGMLFETVGASKSGIFVEQEVHMLHGDLHVAEFERAWQRIVDHHAMLRTVFVWKDQDEPLQVVLRHVTIPLERQDWRGLSLSEQQAHLRAYLRADRERGFDLSKAPLMRLAIFQTGAQTVQFVWTLHHILMDGWCRPLIFEQFTSCYLAYRRGLDAHLEQSRSYGDYVAWLKQQDLSEAATFWSKTLDGFTRPTALGTEADSVSFVTLPERYGYQEARLSDTATAALQAWARQQRLTLNTLVQGVWALLLHRYSGDEDVVFGTTVSGRPPELDGVESMIGLFINSLPSRVTVSPETSLISWLKDIQARHLACREYEYCSTGQIHQWSVVPGSLPLYESLLVFQNYKADASIETVAEHRDGSPDQPAPRGKGAQTNHALTILASVDRELSVHMVYDGRRMEGTSVARMLLHFLTLLERLADHSNQPLRSLLHGIPVEEIPRILPPQFRRTPGTAPRTPTELALSRIWSELLGLEQISVHDHFFSLGGHSLLATQLVSRIRGVFNLELPLRCLFESGTIAELAPIIERILLNEVEAMSEDAAQRLINGAS